MMAFIMFILRDQQLQRVKFGRKKDHFGNTAKPHPGYLAKERVIFVPQIPGNQVQIKTAEKKYTIISSHMVNYRWVIKYLDK